MINKYATDEDKTIKIKQYNKVLSVNRSITIQIINYTETCKFKHLPS